MLRRRKDPAATTPNEASTVSRDKLGKATCSRRSALRSIPSVLLWVTKLGVTKLVSLFRFAIYLAVASVYTAVLKFSAFSLGAVATTLIFSRYSSSDDNAALQKMSALARSTNNSNFEAHFFSGLNASSGGVAECLTGQEPSDVCIATAKRWDSVVEGTWLGMRDTDLESLEAAWTSTKWTLMLWAQALSPLANAITYYAVINAQRAAAAAIGFFTDCHDKHLPLLRHHLSNLCHLCWLRAKPLLELSWGELRFLIAESGRSLWRYITTTSARELVTLVLVFAATVTTLCLLYRYARFITRFAVRCKKCVASTTTKLSKANRTTRRSVVTLYHARLQVLLAVAAGLSLYFVPRAVTVFAQSAWVDTLLNLVVPASYSVKALRKKSNPEQERWLVYWCCRGSFQLLSEVPFVSSSVRTMPMCAEIGFLSLVWLLLAGSVGGRVVLFVIKPIVGWNSSMTFVPRGSARLSGYFSSLLQMAHTFRLVPTSAARLAVVIKERCKGLGLISLVFLFTPGFLTYYGNLLAGVLHPLQMSLSVLHAKRTCEKANKCRELLSFWAVYNVALAILKWCLGGWLSFFPFVQHLELLLTLVLLFGGADAAMDFTLHLWSELHAAHIRVREEVSSPARKSQLKPKPSSSMGITKEKKKTPTRVASEEKEGSSLMAKFDSVEDEVMEDAPLYSSGANKDD